MEAVVEEEESEVVGESIRVCSWEDASIVIVRSALSIFESVKATVRYPLVHG